VPPVQLATMPSSVSKMGVKNERSSSEVAAVGVCHGSRRAARTTIAVWIFGRPGYGYYQGILVAL
jgi:hypothetical protein